LSTPRDKNPQTAENISTNDLLARTDMTTKKPRLTIYLTEERKQFLERWAEEEKRTLTNLVGLILDAAIDEKGKLSKTKQKKEK
jgi:uncharacterized protein (DUF1778 family)